MSTFHCQRTRELEIGWDTFDFALPDVVAHVLLSSFVEFVPPSSPCVSNIKIRTNNNKKWITFFISSCFLYLFISSWNPFRLDTGIRQRFRMKNYLVFRQSIHSQVDRLTKNERCRQIWISNCKREAKMRGICSAFVCPTCHWHLHDKELAPRLVKCHLLHLRWLLGEGEEEQDRIRTPVDEIFEIEEKSRYLKKPTDVSGV